MENPTHPKSAKAKTHPWGPLTTLWALLGLIRATLGGSPHQTYSLKWQVLSPNGEIVWEIQGNHALNTWWPTLTPDFCQLAAGSNDWDIVTQEAHNLSVKMPSVTGRMYAYTPNPVGCASPEDRCALASHAFYVCPRDGRSPNYAYHCGGYDDYYCAAWGCETTRVARTGTHRPHGTKSG